MQKREAGIISSEESVGAGEEYSNSDIDELEKLSMEKANKAISAIENALAVWALSKQKSKDLAPKITRLQYFHEALTKWEIETLKTVGNKTAISRRVKRLREFAQICYRYTS